jgi:hypothetical protein
MVYNKFMSNARGITDVLKGSIFPQPAPEIGGGCVVCGNSGFK